MTLTATIKKGALLLAVSTVLTACDSAQIIGGPLEIGAAQDSNLLSHGGFERGFGDWQSCSDPSLVSIETNDTDTVSSALLEGGGCIFQTQAAAVNDNMIVNCSVRNESNAWAALTFGYLDENFQPLKTVEERIFGQDFSNVSASLRAPANTSFVEVLVYAEDGAEIDNCELINTEAGQPLELLVNSHFEEGLIAWEPCNRGSVTAENGVANLSNSCITQSFTATEGVELELTCDGIKTGDNHSAIALGFLDADSQALAMTETPISDQEGLFPTVALTSPAGTRFAQVLIYTEGEVNLNNCSLHFPSAE